MVTAPAGSEDAGLVLSAEERLRDDLAVHVTCYAAGRCDGPQMLAGVLATVAARVDAARAEERERIAQEIEAEATDSVRSDPDSPYGSTYLDGLNDGSLDGIEHAARIARTPPPAGDDEPLRATNDEREDR